MGSSRRIGIGVKVERRDYKGLQYTLAVLVLFGLGGTALSIVMNELGNDDAPWHFLIALIGIPTALGAAFVALLQAIKEA